MAANNLKIKLNDGQKEAVEHKGGPLLVVAGAGTGKTRVIVEKINRLLADGVKPEQILALTFTEKAAAEMLDRVLESRGQFMLEMPIMTFNSYGGSILREFNVDIGLSHNHLLLGENAKIVFLRQHLEQLELDYFSPLSNPEGLLPDVASFFSKLKQHVITPAAYKKFVDQMPAGDEGEKLEKTKHQELARAYQNYLRLCQENNVIDFDDQIYRVIELLEARPNIRKNLRDRYRTTLVDEFQDTNPMQSRLIDLLVNEDQNIIVVGDDDQSIYGFRGATLANILEFKKRYPNAQEATLNENYRSSQAILDASYQLIQHNNPHRLEAQLGITKKLAGQFAGAPPELREFSTLSAEMRWIASDIKQRLKNGQEPGSIAILCRRNAIISQLHEVLELEEVEHVVIGERYQLYKTEIIRAMLEALRAVADPNASMHLYHALAGPLFEVPGAQLAEYASKARREKQHLEEYLLEQEVEECRHALEHILKWREAAASLSVGRLLFKIIEESGFKDRLYTQALEHHGAALSVTQLSQFFRTLKEFESVAPLPTVFQYLQSFPVLEAAGESDEDGTLDVSSEKVNLLTIHKAKGLEWRTVYIPDCTEGSFPLRNHRGGIPIPIELVEDTISEADEHLAEERRLMYVALTRAKEDAILSYALKAHTPAPKKPSRFLPEIFGSQTAQVVESKENFETPVISIANTPDKPLSLPRSMYQSNVLSLSVSQIACFIECPLNFYYRYVLNVPQPPNAAASYGTAIHAAIEELNRARANNETVALETLQQILDQKWSNAGYLSKSHAKKAREQANATIDSFYESQVGAPVPTRVEWPFSVHLKEPEIIINGRLDAVFESEEGVEIRDYKTSTTVTTEEKAKQRATSSDQLTLYALVWQQLTGELPTRLSLEFVDTGIHGSVKKTQRGVDGMLRKITAMQEDINNKHYPPRGEHRFCDHPPL